MCLTIPHVKWCSLTAGDAVESRSDEFHGDLFETGLEHEDFVTLTTFTHDSRYTVSSKYDHQHYQAGQAPSAPRIPLHRLSGKNLKWVIYLEAHRVDGRSSLLAQTAPTASTRL